MGCFERIERSNDARSYYPSDVAETILNQNKIVLLLPINISVAVTILQTNWVIFAWQISSLLQLVCWNYPKSNQDAFLVCFSCSFSFVLLNASFKLNRVVLAIIFPKYMLNFCWTYSKIFDSFCREPPSCFNRCIKMMLHKSFIGMVRSYFPWCRSRMYIHWPTKRPIFG